MPNLLNGCWGARQAQRAQASADAARPLMLWPRLTSLPAVAAAPPPLQEFASQQRRQANVQTYQLGGSVCSWPGAVPPARSEAALLARAKANMERFCVVVIAVGC